MLLKFEKEIILLKMGICDYSCIFCSEEGEQCLTAWDELPLLPLTSDECYLRKDRELNKRIKRTQNSFRQKLYERGLIADLDANLSSDQQEKYDSIAVILRQKHDIEVCNCSECIENGDYGEQPVGAREAYLCVFDRSFVKTSTLELNSNKDNIEDIPVKTLQQAQIEHVEYSWDDWEFYTEDAGPENDTGYREILQGDYSCYSIWFNPKWDKWVANLCPYCYGWAIKKEYSPHPLIIKGLQEKFGRDDWKTLREMPVNELYELIVKKK